jgi:hypothetical protein
MQVFLPPGGIKGDFGNLAEPVKVIQLKIRKPSFASQHPHVGEQIQVT